MCVKGFCVRRDAMQKACFTVSSDTVQHTLIRGQCHHSVPAAAELWTIVPKLGAIVPVLVPNILLQNPSKHAIFNQSKNRKCTLHSQISTIYIDA